MNKETEDQISQLQMLEQNLQNITMQKQNFQAHLFEVENAIKELSESKGPVYKIVGAIMVSQESGLLKKDLESKKDLLEMRVKNLKKQEDSIKEKAGKIQAEVVKVLQSAK